MNNFNYQPLEADSIGAYEAEKLAFKNSVFQGTVILTKSSFGIGAFMFQYYFLKSGLVFGIIITILVVSLINFFLAVLSSLANKVSKEREIEIETLNELTNIVVGGGASFFVKLMVILLSQGTIISCLIVLVNFFTSHIAPLTGSDLLQQEWLIKLVFIVVFAVIALSIVEMEKVKFASMVSLAVYLLSFFILYVCVIIKGTKEGFNNHFTHSDSSYFINLISITAFTVESVPNLFSIRATLRERSKMPEVVLNATISLILLCLVNGITLLSVS